MTEELRPRIVVFGVGGAGGNAVDNMIEANLQGVEFVVANTDAQALNRSKTENRIQLGPDVTRGLGAGARPDVGAEAAEESHEEISAYLDNAHMVFIAAGMGGGTGTGAAPVIARAAHERGILTVGVVTKPFGFEGARRMQVAQSGLVQMRESVDTLIIVPNQNLFRIANERTTFADAFRMADDVLYSGVRGITDLMVMPGLINLDFADVRSIMTGMGSAMMGMGEATGDQRALEAARAAIDNPLLDDVTMEGARGVLINITGGYDMTLFELDEAANEIRAQVDENANIILGSTFDHELDGKIRVSVVAAGLEEGKKRAAPPATAAVSTPAAVAPDAVDPVAPMLSADAPVVVTPEEAPSIEDMLEPEPAALDTGLRTPDTGAADLDRPTIITEPEPRGDFNGRDLPAAHAEAQPGDDAVPADQVLGRPEGSQSSPVERDAAADEPGRASEPASDAPANAAGAGFASLFGWRRDGSSSETDAETPVNSGEKGAPQATTDAAPFDDSDLEIPAFLRRSANH
ncbi:MAG: cell division protein FtsZ [Pseudomonadota bacterium]